MYSGRVLVGFWFDKLQLEEEKREAQQQRRERGELPCQRKYRLLRSFTRPADLPPPLSTYPAPLRFGQRVQLLAPEAADHSRLLDGASQRCPEDQVPSPRGPQARGLLLAATVSGNEVAGGLRVIGDACPLACVTPGPEPAARDVFVLRDAGRRKCGGPRDDRQGMLVYGREFYLQLAEASEDLYVRSETPLIDGQYGPNYHNPLRLSLSKDGYAKWRAVHWNRHERFETEGMPILPCKRIVIQHVMTGQCLAVEDQNWHRSLIGFEAGVSVHTYSDVHRNETSENIWTMLVGVRSQEDNRGDARKCSA